MPRLEDVSKPGAKRNSYSLRSKKRVAKYLRDVKLDVHLVALSLGVSDYMIKAIKRDHDAGLYNLDNAVSVTRR